MVTAALVEVVDQFQREVVVIALPDAVHGALVRVAVVVVVEIVPHKDFVIAPAAAWMVDLKLLPKLE